MLAATRQFKYALFKEIYREKEEKMCICFLKGHLCTREGYFTFYPNIYSRSAFIESCQQAKSIYVYNLITQCSIQETFATASLCMGEPTLT
jgi:hypothetical protein